MNEQKEASTELVDNRKCCDVKDCGKPASHFEVVQVDGIVHPAFLCEDHYQIAVSNTQGMRKKR